MVAAMTEKEAYAYLQTFVDQHGTKVGIAKAAQALGLKWNTVYGWWRRESVPEWRLAAFDQAKKRKAA
jgi:transposase-like protein